jgi:hypothetical protein
MSELPLWHNSYSLLYYRKFVKSLTGIDFAIKPYNPCVANKKIEGKHMTLFFHVDDCKINHLKTKFMYSMIEYLQQEYEIIFEDRSSAMTVGRGKVHQYLSMPWITPSVVKLKLPCPITLMRFSLSLTRHN